MTKRIYVRNRKMGAMMCCCMPEMEKDRFLLLF